MTGLDAMFGPLWAILSSPYLMGLILLAIPLGMFFGAVPGLGGKLGIVLLIPFVFGMDPLAGSVFLLAMHAVVHTGGSIPSILFGVPGTGPDAATIVDGFPMAQRGEAGRALGASLGASGVGGVIGALFLAAMLPVLKPVILAFSPAEFFLLAVFGITFIAMLSGRSLIKGVAVGMLGLLVSLVGPGPAYRVGALHVRAALALGRGERSGGCPGHLRHSRNDGASGARRVDCQGGGQGGGVRSGPGGAGHLGRVSASLADLPHLRHRGCDRGDPGAGRRCGVLAVLRPCGAECQGSGKFRQG